MANLATSIIAWSPPVFKKADFLRSNFPSFVIVPTIITENAFVKSTSFLETFSKTPSPKSCKGFLLIMSSATGKLLMSGCLDSGSASFLAVWLASGFFASGFWFFAVFSPIGLSPIGVSGIITRFLDAGGSFCGGRLKPVVGGITGIGAGGGIFDAGGICWLKSGKPEFPSIGSVIIVWNWLSGLASAKYPSG